MSKSDLRFVEPTTGYLVTLAREMRDEDVKEIRLSHQHTPLTGLRASVAASDKSWVALAGQSPIAAFGVGGASMLSLVGSPWFLGSKALRAYRSEFGRLSRPMVERLRADYALLENWVHADNLVSVRWLRSCGFTIEPATPFGPYGALFHRFWIDGGLRVCAS
jgi:hypothetical protein